MLKQLSPDTAIKLAKELGIPIEQLVHTPRHIVMQKLAEISARADNQNHQTKNEDSKQ